MLPTIIAHLTPIVSMVTSNEAARLGAQMVEIALGWQGDFAGRYVDFKLETRPKQFGAPSQCRFQSSIAARLECGALAYQVCPERAAVGSLV